MVVEFVGNVLDLGLSLTPSTYKVWSFPLREAGLEPKLLPVSFINKTEVIFD